MGNKRIILISLLLLIAIINVGAAVASEEVIIDDNIDTLQISEVSNNEEIELSQGFTEDLSENIDSNELIDDNKDLDSLELEDANEEKDKLTSSSAEENQLSSTIEIDGSAFNQMNNPTIQDAINSAHEGDTIIITGKSYEHCHFIINKRLTIISEVGTVMSPCTSNRRESGTLGIFYIGPQGSGTTIQGFTLNNALDDDEIDVYNILIRGASDVQIINCTINNTPNGDGIRIENATNTTVRDSIVRNSKHGIKVIDSEQTAIINNNITNNTMNGINIDIGNNDTLIRDNNITYNRFNGINLTSAEYVYILNNFIAYNQHLGSDNRQSGQGVYVNCNITKIEIKGNFFRENGLYAILNDYRVRNIGNNAGDDDLEVIDNNYFIGNSYSEVRVAYTVKYFYKEGKGEFDYDSENDVYIYNEAGTGDWDVDRTIVYLKYAFLKEDTPCGTTLFKPSTTWSRNDYELSVSEISQTEKGVYSVSIVDKKGNVATDLSSIYVIFYLNKNNDYTNPQDGDVYQIVLMQNGTATVKFAEKDYLKTGNVLLACFPGKSNYYKANPYATFNISDSQIPIDSLSTKISISNMNTYPNSGAYITAILKDSKGNALSGQTLTFKLNGKTYTRTTDSKGQAKLQIKLATAKTYVLTARFAGKGGYNKSSAKATITVKKQNQKIVSSNKVFAPKSVDYFQITLKNSANKIIAGKKVTIKVGTKTYTKTTNKKGVIKLKISIAKKGTYKVTIKSKATTRYNAITKTNTITIKALNQKISSANKVFAPSSVNYYSITVKDQNNKVLAGKKVTIKVGTKTYNKKTNKKGIIKLKINLSKKGTYKVTIKSEKTSKYNAKTKTNKITIKALNQKITSSNKKYLPKAGKYYSITLKDQNNKAIAGKTVKFTINSKTYSVKTNKNGVAKLKINLANAKVYNLKIYSPKTKQYNAITKTNKITIEKGIPSLVSYNRTFAQNSDSEYLVYLKDFNGKAIANGNLSFSINGNNYSSLTDNEGMAKLIINLKEAKDYPITINFLGNQLNKGINRTNAIKIIEGTDISFIDEGLPNKEIQRIIDNSPEGNVVEFLGEKYNNVKLSINKPLTIVSDDLTVLTGCANSPVIRINSDHVNLNNLIILANSKTGESDGIVVENSNYVNIVNNIVNNTLDESKIADYDNGSTLLPGYGINIKNSTHINIINNTVNNFESGIYSEYSDNLTIAANEIRLNNYGIKYGFGTANSEIADNTIIDNIGWYVTDVPEGPRGYGIFLNNSAVNITIEQNNISNNYLGISIDANNSTGIVIISNLIADNALEGIRFNAPYDLAEEAVEPVVTDNAVYRNAEGPSLWILGEMSANPMGIYGPGEFNPDLQLKIDPNWYGTNTLRTWDEESGTVGVGTMCPRIQTSTIRFNITEGGSPGTYQINFYKNGELATNLATFDMYATLNYGSDKQIEVHFDVIGGTATFSFDKENFLESGNNIKFSVGSLINVSFRTYDVILTYNVTDDKIPA
ncbi:MAG: right-handed parallel beta-helix repeat-containing protein [Methanobrevibacter sp.]|nr:right-handed parallel beta-helix repeat-containing protein [Methanobrevibacter sp.]